MLSTARASGLLALLLALAVGGCGDDGGGADADAGIDAAPDASGATPIEAPAEQWTWVTIDGMKCGDGSPTGVAVNLTERSDDVVVFLNGGGACWDANTCFTLRTAANLEGGFDAGEFQQVAGSLGSYPLFQRAGAAPFADASYVFVPYCTGDVHAGHKVTTYQTGSGPRDVHHVGQDNLDALWPRLRATRPDADTMFVTGASAGGYGAMIQGPRARLAWPDVTIHVLSDSSHPVNPEATRWAAMKASWNVDMPPDCAACASGLAGYPAYLRTVAPAGSRWGLIMTTRDQTIGAYMGYSGPDLEVQTLAIRDLMTDVPGQAAFVVEGTAHVLTGSNPMTSGGVQLATWLADFATGGPGWRTVGP